MRRKPPLDPSDLALGTTARYTHGPFDYERLDVFTVARQALSRGEEIAAKLPAEHGYLAEQLRHALLDAYLGVAETATETGPPRVAAARTTRAKAAQAAAALAYLDELGIVPTDELEPTIHLLGRLCAMLTRLASRMLPR